MTSLGRLRRLVLRYQLLRSEPQWELMVSVRGRGVISGAICHVVVKAAHTLACFVIN